MSWEGNFWCSFCFFVRSHYLSYDFFCNHRLGLVWGCVGLVWRGPFRFAYRLPRGCGGLAWRGLFVFYWCPCAEVKGFEIFFDELIHFILDLTSVCLLWDLVLDWLGKTTLFVFIHISCSTHSRIWPVFFKNGPFCVVSIWCMPTPVMVIALLIYIFCRSRPDHVFDRTRRGGSYIRLYPLDLLAAWNYPCKSGAVFLICFPFGLFQRNRFFS